MEDEYGPQWQEVEKVLGLASLLNDDRMDVIARAYIDDYGRPHGRFAYAAARMVGRSEYVDRAVRAAAMEVHLRGMLTGMDPRTVEAVAWAAMNAVTAMATEDLIGIGGFTTVEYAKLVEPWFAGFDDMPILEREERT